LGIKCAKVVGLVETPAGSTDKLEFNRKKGEFVVKRKFPNGLSCPGNYGEIEGTLAEDGDALDFLCVRGAPAKPGDRLRMKVIGIARFNDEKGRDDKLICVPMDCEISSLNDLSEEERNAALNFFPNSKKGLPGKYGVLDGVDDAEAARTKIAACIDRYKKKD